MHINSKISLSMLAVGVALGLFTFGYVAAVPVLVTSLVMVWGL